MLIYLQKRMECAGHFSANIILSSWVRAVQEIYSGRDFYHCMVGVVMTNSRFTKNAVTLANELNILLLGWKHA